MLKNHFLALYLNLIEQLGPFFIHRVAPRVILAMFGLVSCWTDNNGSSHSGSV